MKKVALKLKRISADALVTLAGDIHDKLAANAAVFDSPTVPLTILATNIENLRMAHQDSRMGGISATIYRNERRRIVEEDLLVLANYVENLARNNEELITMAGMPLKRRGPLRYDSLEAPSKLALASLYSETVSIRWKGVFNAKSYEVQYCLDPIAPEAWKKAPVISAAKTLVNGLMRKEEYWFRVRALGSQGIVSDWSSPSKVLVS